MVNGILVSVVEKVKQDGSGTYYLVNVNDADTSPNNALPQHLCFDKKITGIKVGEKFSFLSSEKNDRHFMNFPKESKAGAGGGAGYRKQYDDEKAKLNTLLSTFTMPMSYAKDITCALIAKMDFGANLEHGFDPVKASSDICLSLYRSIRAEILSDKSLQKALSIKVDTEQASQEKNGSQSDLRSDMGKAVRDYRVALKSLGWIIPDGAFESMLERMSGKKAEDGHLINGKKTVNEMDDDELNQFKTRFFQFTHNDCVGDPKECKFYNQYRGQKTSGKPDHFCSWTTRCFYVENKLGKNG